MRRVLITVGSTKFDNLIELVLGEQMIEVFSKHGFTNVVVQCGNSSLFPEWVDPAALPIESIKSGVHIHVWRFKPSLEEEISNADLVISHAGSGTILDALRKKKLLIVVPNDTLLDNHQLELAVALGEQRYLVAASVSTLPETIATIDSVSLETFPDHDRAAFRAILDEEMGFL
ncbi:N-acetylglucosaminyldiphosphodolichol N-acetylglucosaminyltransferase catalytic subunit alg13 [Tulasnella sp. 419]|nr:N-acetylglucosaminyldiphosphodolichol N-acetylglucosaminyltransferase catalytic subunit alg13 [Tulasnella sp. 419]